MEERFYYHVLITAGADTKKTVPGVPYCRTWRSSARAMAYAEDMARALRANNYPEAIVRMQVDYSSD